VNNRDKVIVALDTQTAVEAVTLAQKISPIFPFFKIGIKLFTQAGPELVREVLRHGKVFLDLKFYDIPTVVADAVQQAGQLGVSLLTLHASGGTEMMQLCVERKQKLENPPLLLGVTVLTSLADLTEFGFAGGISQQVDRLADLAHMGGMDGIVCSPIELTALRKRHPAPFRMVTPGIRGVEDAKGDQKRTASPAEALQAGADFLVIGRPIIAASDPESAARRIANSIE
jgi:orotidine-5'-phosphate decarboxylase